LIASLIEQGMVLTLLPLPATIMPQSKCWIVKQTLSLVLSLARELIK